MKSVQRIVGPWSMIHDVLKSKYILPSEWLKTTPVVQYSWTCFKESIKLYFGFCTCLWFEACWCECHCYCELLRYWWINWFDLSDHFAISLSHEILLQYSCNILARINKLEQYSANKNFPRIIPKDYDTEKKH